MFSTTAHTSSYGNMLMLVCLSEVPYGAQTINLTAIRQPGGSMRKYVLNGYSLTVTPLSGNPTSDSYNGCATGPGETTVYVGQVAGAQDLDTINLAPPSPLPFGASKMLVRYGYYPLYMAADPVVDCTTGCAITLDDSNAKAWYQIVYADSNNVPKSVGQPQQLAR
jgi:hypothetical protein